MSTEEEAPIVVKKRGRPAGPPKPPKEKKPRGRPKGEGPRAPKPTHAPFVKLVEQAIESLYERKGVSKQAIVRYIMSKEPECVDKVKTNKSVKIALKRLVEKGALEAPGGKNVGKFKKVGEKTRGRPKKGESPAKAKKTVKKSPAKSPAKAKKKLKIALKMKPKKAKTPNKKAKKDGETPKKRGRPKIKKTDETPKVKGQRGRPKGTPNKPKAKRGRPKKTE